MSPVRSAAAVNLFEKCLKDSSPQKKRLFYQILVFVIIFLTHVCYHMNARTFINVKDVLAPECNETTSNSYHPCIPWKPFSSPNDDTYLFSILDFVYMITRSASYLVSGHIAENMDLRVFLSCGMLMTGLGTALFGFTKYIKVHSMAFFVMMQVLGGIVHSTGLPAIVEVIGMWFPKGHLGLVYGLMGLSRLVSHFIASLMSENFGWGYRFLIPSVLITLVALLVHFCLVPTPNIVNLHIDKNARTEMKTLENEEEEKDEEPRSQMSNEVTAIGFRRACKIPGIFEYSVSYGFVSFVNFTFFFWLPFFIRLNGFEGRTLPRAEASLYSTFFDLGGGLGVILAGILYDYTDVPGIICTTMLVCAAPNLSLFIIKGTTFTMLSTYMTLNGVFTLGPGILIESVVSARLASHESVKQLNVRSIAVISCIIGACGSVGAAVGPLAAGFVFAKTEKWVGVVLVMMFSDLIAVLILSRQLLMECRMILRKIREIPLFDYTVKDREQVKDVREADRLLENTDES